MLLNKIALTTGTNVISVDPNDQDIFLLREEVIPILGDKRYDKVYKIIYENMRLLDLFSHYIFNLIKQCNTNPNIKEKIRVYFISNVFPYLPIENLLIISINDDILRSLTVLLADIKIKDIKSKIMRDMALDRAVVDAAKNQSMTVPRMAAAIEQVQANRQEEDIVHGPAVVGGKRRRHTKRRRPIKRRHTKRRKHTKRR